MRYEILDGPAVINTIEADEAFMLANFAPEQYREAPAPTPPPAPAPVWQWYIDVGPFFDRLGAQKMPVLLSADATVKALIADLQVRKWVDLQRADVAAGLAYIGSVIPAVNSTLRTAILTTPPSKSENLALRKLYFY